MQNPVKDEERAHPVPEVWRPALRAVIDAFRIGDYTLASPVPMVESVDQPTADRMKAYVANYGETLAALPDETWSTSVSQWMERYWDVLVDLWTEESGESDLVLAVRVFEDGDAYRVRVSGLYVP